MYRGRTVDLRLPRHADARQSFDTHFAKSRFLHGACECNHGAYGDEAVFTRVYYAMHYGSYGGRWAGEWGLEMYQSEACALDLHGLVNHIACDGSHVGLFDGTDHQCAEMGRVITSKCLYFWA